ncbi:hypothetical protein EVA_11708 [gut metagenome]|uniref:Uncharacterized protein n=1 Tax=gut metagenome TaxID=749906 RepID=J9FYY5_9ZZZZ
MFRFIQLHLHHFKFILISPFLVTNFLTGNSTMIIAGHKLWICINHLAIILNSTPKVTRLRAKQSPIK